MSNVKSIAAWLTGLVLLILSIASSAQAQTVTFSAFNDALPARCYNPATTAPDSANANRLKIGIHTGSIPGTFAQSAACVASDAGPTSMLDTISFLITAPANYYIKKITFTQSGTTYGARGGAGFRGATWVVDDDALTVPTTASGWSATVDYTLTGQKKTEVPVAITTFLAAGGGSLRTGTASASNPSVLVELAELVP